MAGVDLVGAGVRVGVVGAGRTRQGLGPFLARWFEAAGAEVVGVSGRSVPRARAAANSLASALGHPVAAHPDARSLAAAVDLLVVACPVEGHLDGLDAALEAGVACLCEKPLTSWRELDRCVELVQAFRARGLLLAENCQWPYALDALDQLFPGARGRPIRAVSMRLSPAWPGPLMVEDSLSHLLSLLQALVPLPRDARVRDVSQSDPGDAARDNVVQFSVCGDRADVRAELSLRCCAEQPRPAWIQVEDVRLDREIGDDYAIAFRAEDGRVCNVRDPLAQLVYGVLGDLQANRRERSDDIADAIELRAKLYGRVLRGLQARG